MSTFGQQTIREKLTEDLTPSQRQAVFHREGPLLVIAVPGSGKTRVITYRIAALIDSGVRPQSICAITFTNKAAEEMRQRAVALGASGGAHISTFHSLCVRVLRQYAEQAGVLPNFSIYDDADQRRCMREAIKDCELDTTNFAPARMLEGVSALKNKLLGVDEFKDQAEDFFSKALARVYDRYQRMLEENNALDFDDLLMKAALMLERCGDVCALVSNRFRYLLIDEYQDTNHAQYRIAKALVSEHNNICATGDPDQSIYRWRGADIRNILAFEQDWPDATVVKLEENFRSTPNILTAADSLIAHNESRKQKKLIATCGEGADVTICCFEDEAAEARGLAEKVRQSIADGCRAGDIAVFYRVNAQSRALEEALIKNKIPYQIVRGVEFYSRKEIRDVLAYLKVLANPNDEMAFLRIINTPTRGIGKVTIDRLRGYAERNGIGLLDAMKSADNISSLGAAAVKHVGEFANLIGRLRKNAKGPVAPVVEQVFAESGLEQSLEAEGAEGKNALDNVGELINAAALYDQQANEPSLVDWLQQISLFSDADVYDPEAQRVALMTLHTAKGLEFDTVFIVGVEEGLLPHERSGDDGDELEEERRLFFVGITRAKSNLHISYARYRTIRGQLQRTMRSRFLSQLGMDFIESLTADIGEPALSQDAVRASGLDFSESFAPSCLSGGKNNQSSVINNQLSPRFKRGDLVVHSKFGLGTVKEFDDMGENSVVTIEFNGGEVKSLALKYAKLKKL